MFRLLSLFLSLLPLTLAAQFTRSYASNIRSLQMEVNERSEAPPVLTLGSDDEILFSFDDLSHTYHRYTYRLVHCTADWSASELMPIDYLEGFNDRPIDDWQNSENTTQLYTHYQFYLPNEDAAPKVSGNYKVEIYDDEADGSSPVAVFGFAVVEPRVRVEARVSPDTEIDRNATHQQVSFVVDYAGYNISSPVTDVKVRVFQNRRLDNFVEAIKPTYVTSDRLEYVHNKALIFDAGNEYRRFELTDPHRPGMNVERVSFLDPHYHAELYADAPLRSYSNTRDENGRFYTNTLEGYGSAIEADYALVHFRLDAPYRSGGNYYLLGDYWGNLFTDSNILVYDYAEGAYLSSQLMKFGVHNYRYVWLPEGQRKALTATAEGDFFNTENEYLIFVYHREFGARYDKLIAVQQINFSY